MVEGVSARAAASTGPRARCNRLSSLLVQNWNRRTGVQRELQSHHNTCERWIYLTGRHHQLCREQDTLEVELTRASLALLAEVSE
jgi:hypothetical protein